MEHDEEDVCKNYGWFQKDRPPSSRRMDVHSQDKKNLNNDESDHDKHVRIKVDRT